MEGVGGLKDMRVGEKGFVSESEEQNKALVRRFLEAVQKGDSDTMHELLSPDFVDHSLLPGQEPGRDGYIEAVAEDHAAFQVGDELAAPMLRLYMSRYHADPRFIAILTSVNKTGCY